MPILELHHKHPWNLPPGEAIQLQQTLRSQMMVEPLDLAGVHRVAGVDVGFPEPETARAAIVSLSFPDLQPLEEKTAEIPLAFPYIPGLLSFREIPAILAVVEALSQLPDVFLVDGHGFAHPRRFGIACHLGVLLGMPTLGCAKSILVGRYGELADSAGSTADLLDREEVIGTAVRTRQGVKPVFVSIGHRIDLPSSTRLALLCGRGYRLPEPIRLADQLASMRGQKRPV